MDGLRFVHEPKTLRFFTGKLEPIGNWPEKLIEAYIADFGENSNYNTFEQLVKKRYNAKFPPAGFFLQAIPCRY